MSYGKQVASKAMAAELAKMLPGMDTDYSVLADALVDAVELAAVATLDHREQAIQQMLARMMEYYGTVLHDDQERIAKLTSERADLVLKLAAMGNQAAYFEEKALS